MKRITVYADFDFLSAPQEIGTLGYEHIRGKDHFVFEYSREWLKQHGGLLLSGDLLNVPSLQHPRGNDNVFGFVKDSFPDRWGRLLLDRRERLTAQQEGRSKRMLTNYDYLIGIEDFTRMGGIRYKEEEGSDYINASTKYLVPPIESLRALCDACHEIELAEERNELPEQRWLDQWLILTANCTWQSSLQKRIWRILSLLSTSRINLRPRLASTWQRRAPSRFQRTVTCFFQNASIEQQKAVAYTLLLLCRCLVLMMELAAAQETAILTSLISFFVGVPMCVRISANSIAEWHSTLCLATPMTISVITVSC